MAVKPCELQTAMTDLQCKRAAPEAHPLKRELQRNPEAFNNDV